VLCAAAFEFAWSYSAAESQSREARALSFFESAFVR
jgi:hypothetical protein